MDPNIRYFQWVVGERKGEIVIFDKIETEDGLNYIVFKDRSRVNEDFVAPLNENNLTGKFMAEIEHPDNGWKFHEEWVGEEVGKMSEDLDDQGRRHEIPTVTEIASDGKKGPIRRKVVRLIPPRPSYRPSNFGMISNVPTQPAQHSTVPVSTLAGNIDATDPVYILMSKAKKVDSEISMTLSISLPSKSLYNIAKDSFDDGEKKFVEYIIQNVTVDEIKEALKIAITNMYNAETL
jgi:hypothetical protein